MLLEDVFPGGESSVVLSLGAARAVVGERAARGLEPRPLDVRLSPVHHELQPGHALRMSVMASLWPLFHPRSGVGADRRFARRRLHLRGGAPSQLTIPTG